MECSNSEKEPNVDDEKDKQETKENDYDDTEDRKEEKSKGVEQRERGVSKSCNWWCL